MKLVTLFLLAEAMFFHPKINGLQAANSKHILFHLMSTYSQNDTQLRLSRKNISSVPVKAFQSFTALEVLELLHNNLTYDSLPCGSLTITTLRHLNIASNQLEHVPSCLPTPLEFLDLSKNIIQQIEFSVFMDLHNLSVLLLSHNKITEIATLGTVVQQLVSLDLSYNNLTRLQWKFQGPNLAFLRLEGNSLQELNPYEFGPFPKLHYLNLSSTSLESCSYKAFASETENIKILDLSENFFKTLDPQCFEGLSNLQILRMRRMPFLQSLPVDLFLYTSHLIHLDLAENPQLHLVNSSMFEQLLYLQTLSLKSCNLTEFRPWKYFPYSTVTVTLSENHLGCRCELAWLIREPEKLLLNRANDTRCEESGSQREILLVDFIDECEGSRNYNKLQELQTDAKIAQNQQLVSTTTIYHNPTAINVKTSNKLPMQSSNEFQLGITISSFVKSMNLPNAVSDSNSGTLQLKESLKQNDQTWNKVKSWVKSSTPLTITTRDQMGSELYPANARDLTETSPYPTNGGQTETETYLTIIRDRTVSKSSPLPTDRSQIGTLPNLEIRDQIKSKPFPTTGEQMVSEPCPTTKAGQRETKTYPVTRIQPVTGPHPLTTRDQTVTGPHPPTTRDQTVIEPHPPTTREQTVTRPHPMTTREQTVTRPHPMTTRDQTVTRPHAPTTRDQTVTSPHPPTTRDQTVTGPHPPTTRDQTVTSPHPLTTRDQTVTGPHPLTTRDQTVTGPHLLTTRDQTVTEPHPMTTRDQTVTEPHPPTTRDQTVTGPHLLTTRDQTVTEPHPMTTRDQTVTGPHPPTTRDQTVTEPHPPTTRDQMVTRPHPPTTRDQTVTGPHPPTTRDQTVTGPHPPTTRDKTVTGPHPPTTRDQTVTGPHPPTSRDQTVTGPHPLTTRDQTVTGPHPPTTRDQTVTGPHPPTTRDQTVTGPHPPTTRDQTVTGPHPPTTRDQTVTGPHPPTTRDQTVTGPHPLTTRDQTVTEPHPPTTRDQTVTGPHPPTTRDQTVTGPHPPTTRDQTVTGPHPPTTRDQTVTGPHPPTTRDQTVTEPYQKIEDQTGTEPNLTITREQSGDKYYPITTREPSGSKVTLQTTTLPELSSISTTKRKGPIFIRIEDDEIESLEKEEITSPTPGDCNYDPCRHWQVPCLDLQRLTGCLCPITTGEDVIPDPVKIQKVIKISDNSAEIYWCAPSSTVLYYYIIYQSDDNRRLYKTDTIKPTYRRYTLRDLTSDSTYHTCVVAVNKAGSSIASSIWPSKGPCYIFKTKPNYNNIFYVASTLIIAIFFILVIILSVFLCKIRQKGRLTHLSRISLDPLSLQNPVFDDHLELADPRTIRSRTPDSEQIL